jgi:hypothetical protein|tara:strand:- start:853 stop:1026 length:174 start_codon:yes stop_codon:yes gene_type:complete
VRVNLTKKDIEVCLHASQYFFESPDEFSLPDYKKDYEQWQKTKEKLWKALDEMEKGK